MRHTLAAVCFVVTLAGVVRCQPAAAGGAPHGGSVATGAEVRMEDGAHQILEIVELPIVPPASRPAPSDGAASR